MGSGLDPCLIVAGGWLCIATRPLELRASAISIRVDDGHLARAIRLVKGPTIIEFILYLQRSSLITSNSLLIKEEFLDTAVLSSAEI